MSLTSFICLLNPPPCELKRPVKTQCHALDRSALGHRGQRSEAVGQTVL